MFLEKKGFTLIELLIVVAIIAILAAIAIPNFMQAQIRAKVSRARSDMQTIATALEAYYVDGNTYPGCIEGYPGVGVETFLPTSITTPVAYMSSNAINDPFHDPEPDVNYLRYRYMEWSSFCKTIQRQMDYENLYGKWRIASYGPDRALGPLDYWTTVGGTSGWIVCPYDPTNGSASWGDVMRSQKNVVEESKPQQ